MNFRKGRMYSSNENILGTGNVSISYDIDNFMKVEPALVKSEQINLSLSQTATDINSLVGVNISNQIDDDNTLGLIRSRKNDQNNVHENASSRLSVQGIEAENFPKKEPTELNPNSRFSKNNEGNINIPNNEDKGFQWDIFHNPFDIGSYPITNPPIFDSTMMLPFDANDGSLRRRRISISNGQIGQIVNHQAYFENESPTPEFRSPDLPNDRSNTASVLENNLIERITPSTQQQTLLQHPSQSIENTAAPIMNINSQPLSGHIEQSSVSDKPILTSISAPNEAPQYQIIYNNEVISTHVGPMPGTAAWKKERLLERNRVAASKCRQRKKQIQRQLQTSITEYQEKEKISNIKLSKYQKLMKLYNKQLKIFFNEKSNNLESLRKFIDIENIDDIDEGDLA